MKLLEQTPERVRAARRRAGLTQEQAAALIHLRSRMRWSEYERGVHAMDCARWELFLLKTDQHPTMILQAHCGVQRHKRL